MSVPAEKAVNASKRVSASEVKREAENIQTHLPDAAFYVVMDLKVGAGPSHPITVLKFGSGYTSGNKNPKDLTTSVHGHVAKMFGLPCYTRDDILASHFSPNLKCSDADKAKTAYFWNMAVCNKDLMRELFVRANLLEVRPKCASYFTKYEKGLAEQIQTDFRTTARYIIKAPDATRGEGVFVAEKDHLDLALQILLAGDSKSEYENILDNYRKTLEGKKTTEELDIEIASAMKWRITAKHLNVFIVEEYCPSKPIEISGKFYDATMRATGVVTCYQGKLQFQPLDAYWKAPKLDIKGNALRDSSISYVGEEESRRYAVLESTQLAVFAQLKTILPGFFTQVLSFNMRDYLNSLFKSSSKDEKLKGALLSLEYMSILNVLHLYKETIAVVKELVPYFRELKFTVLFFQLQRVVGEAFLYDLDFDTAVARLSEAIRYLSQLEISSVSVEERIGIYMYRRTAYLLRAEKAAHISNSFAALIASLAATERDTSMKLADNDLKQAKDLAVKHGKNVFFEDVSRKLIYVLSENKEIKRKKAEAVKPLPMATAYVQLRRSEGIKLESKAVDETQRALVREIREKLASYKDKKGYPNEAKLKLFIDLIISPDYVRNFPKALRNICAYEHNPSAFELGKILLKHMANVCKDNMSAVIDEVPISSNGKIARSALGHTETRGNEDLSKLLRSYKAALKPRSSPL